jgi:hypothetical protein
MTNYEPWQCFTNITFCAVIAERNLWFLSSICQHLCGLGAFLHIVYKNYICRQLLPTCCRKASKKLRKIERLFKERKLKMNSTTTEARTILWTGQSGSKYKYSIYKIGTNFKDIAGNYVYAQETKPNSWSPKYIGQTNSLKNRLSNHEKESCAIRNGATHIHVHANSSEVSRLSEEKDLVVNWKPPCNEQLI